MTEQELISLHPRYLASRIGDSNVTLNEIPDVGSENEFSISTGYPEVYAKPYSEGGKPLNRSEVNNVFNLLSQLHFYWQMGGSPVWSREIAQGLGTYSGIGGYPKHAHVYVDVDGEMTQFVSTADDNSEEPGPAAKNWVKFINADSLVPKIEALSAALNKVLLSIQSITKSVGTLSGDAANTSSTVASLGDIFMKKSDMTWFESET